MHILITGYSFNMINVKPAAGPSHPQSMTLAYRYTWKRGDPLIVGHLVRVHRDAYEQIDPPCTVPKGS